MAICVQVLLTSGGKAGCLWPEIHGGQSAQLAFVSSRGRPLPSPALPDLNQAAGLVACAWPVQTDLGDTSRLAEIDRVGLCRARGTPRGVYPPVVLKTSCQAASRSFQKMQTLQPTWPLLPHQNLLREATGI